MRKMSRYIKNLLMGIILLAYIICGKEDVFASESNNNMVISEIDMGDYSDKMTVGEKQLLVITLIPSGFENKDIVYESSNEVVATINQMGRITALKSGKTTIRVSCENIDAKFVLTVNDQKEEEVIISDLEIGEYDKKMYVNKTQTISATVVPSDASQQAIKYQSSDPRIAKVSSTGEVKALSSGNVIIYVKAGEVVKELPITVAVQTKKIVLSKTYIILKPKDNYKLNVQVLPKEANQNVTFSVEDKEVATISASGEIVANAIGNTIIIIKNGEYTESVSLIVNEEYRCVSEDDRDIQVSGNTNNGEFDYTVSSQDIEIISWQRLRDLYIKKKNLVIQGQGYKMFIKGSEILNYKNEVKTNIDLYEDNNRAYFVINEGGFLCGVVWISFDKKHGEYLYLYNDTKKVYELLDNNGYEDIPISKAGKYMISPKKISMGMDWIIYVLITGIVFTIGGTIVYIVTKKKHWFW